MGQSGIIVDLRGSRYAAWTAGCTKDRELSPLSSPNGGEGWEEEVICSPSRRLIRKEALNVNSS
jgi:hypothetical protein